MFMAGRSNVKHQLSTNVLKSTISGCVKAIPVLVEATAPHMLWRASPPPFPKEAASIILRYGCFRVKGWVL